MNQTAIRRGALIGALALACWPPTALATVISYAGDLRTDATLLSCGPGCTLGPGHSDGDFAQYAAVVKTFIVPVASDVQAISFSYGGGVNGDLVNILRGGLEPYLSLFDSGGNFLASTSFGVTCPTGANVNPDTGTCYDVRLDAGTLAAGSYQIALSAYLNLSFAENSGAGTLADGFTGIGNLPFGLDLHYAFDVILNASAAPVPEPATSVLGACGLLVIYLSNRNRKGKQS